MFTILNTSLVLLQGLRWTTTEEGSGNSPEINYRADVKKPEPIFAGIYILLVRTFYWEVSQIEEMGFFPQHGVCVRTDIYVRSSFWATTYFG